MRLNEEWPRQFIHAFGNRAEGSRTKKRRGGSSSAVSITSAKERSTVRVQGWGNDKSQDVDQTRFQQRLGQCDAPVHPDVTAGSPLATRRAQISAPTATVALRA